MKTSALIAVVAALVALLGFVATPSARAAETLAGVVDNGKFFSQDAVAKANKQLVDLERKHGKSLRVETYQGIPDELKDRYAPEYKAEFFQRWTWRRARELGLEGVMVLVNREPS